MVGKRSRTLEGKVSIITGGSMGIGEAVAHAFAGEGSQLVLAARNEADLRRVKHDLDGVGPAVEVLPTDVSRQDQVQDLVAFTLQKFGDINVLVNCAGLQKPIGLVTDVDSGEWLYTVETNLFGTFLCIKAVLPTMIKNGGGKIINMSGGGSVSPRPRFSAYSASKAAIVRLTETLAAEVRQCGIDINAVSPGAVNTRLLGEVLAAGQAAGEQEMVKCAKQKREGGVPRDKVAELIVFLASPETDGLTGRLVSLIWDNWRDMPRHITEIMASDVYTMRRIIPADRGKEW